MTDAPALVPAATAALDGGPTDDLDAALQAAGASVQELDAVGDLDGSADYKRHLADVLLGRATRAAIAEAVGRA
jgi:carbon-monoxide dehydrogenase medium subunit